MARDKGSDGSTDDSTEARPRRRHRDWSGAWVALLLGLSGLALGRLGTLWIRFDVFSQFSVQFAVLAAAGLLALLVPRLKGLAAAVLFVAGLALYGSWPLLATRGPEAPLQAGEKRLRVMQFNIHGDALRIDEALASIHQLDPDVISLVELNDASKPLLNALAKDWPQQATCWQIADCETAVVARVPIAASTSNADWEGANYTLATLGPEFGGLRILATHTTRFPYARAQFRQIQAMVHLLEGGGALIAMGDFNATPFSRVTADFERGLGLTRQTALPSWPADKFMPQIAIDHVFTSAGIRALDKPVAGLPAGSDHLPVSVTLAVPVK